MKCPLFFFVCQYTIFYGVAHAKFFNVTVDDTDLDSIQYYPSDCFLRQTDEWSAGETTNVALAYNNTLTHCDGLDSTVTFVFTGTAAFLISPLWPYSITVMATIDFSPPQLVNLTDPNAATVINGDPTVASHVVWGARRLGNSSHTVVLSDPMSMGGYHNLQFDGIMYTVDSAADTPSSPTTTSVSSWSSSSAALSPQSSSSSHVDILAIALALGLSVLAGVGAVLIAYHCGYRSKRQRLRLSIEPLEYGRQSSLPTASISPFPLAQRTTGPEITRVPTITGSNFSATSSRPFGSGFPATLPNSSQIGTSNHSPNSSQASIVYPQSAAVQRQAEKIPPSFNSKFRYHLEDSNLVAPPMYSDVV